MLKVGLTGGIGSGKSIIAKVFNIVYQIPIFDADKVAKQIMNTDANLIDKIKTTFGNESYTTQNELNRQYLASIVFNNSAKLEILNGLVHEKVRESFSNWVQTQHAPYILHEAAILIESGAYKQMDQVIVVTASEEIRIDRVKKRDKMTTEQVLQRMSKQLPDNEREKHAHFIVDNNNHLSVLNQIHAIHKKITNHG